MIARLAHICFRTDNIKKMVEFYGNMLELKVKFTFKSEKGEIFGYYFDLGNRTFLEIFDNQGAAKVWGGNADPLRQQEGIFYQHFCLEVENLEIVAEKLRNKGIEITPIKVGMDNSKQAWIKDPDNNSVELMQYTEKSLQLA